MPELLRPVIDSKEVYRRVFTDVAYWRPYVLEICRRHGLGRVTSIAGTHPGTYPVFIVDGCYVVKLFGDLFYGAECFRAERAMYDLLASDPGFPAPGLVASGELFRGGEWRWPHLVTTVMPGRPLREDIHSLDDAGRRDVATFLAGTLRRIHALRPPADSPFALTWDAFDALLAGQREGVARRHRHWGSLPRRLIDQIEDWLPPPDGLVDHTVSPHVLHADLHADHVFGDSEGGRWQPAGIIDFTDALTGDRAYELVALHLGTFGGDRRWLRWFLDAYGFDPRLRGDFARRQLAMTLLHEFNVLDGVMAAHQALAEAETLDELAVVLWGVEG